MSIINPREIYERELVKGIDNAEEQIQQNGIDLRIEKVFQLTTFLSLKKDARAISASKELLPKKEIFKLNALIPYLIETKEFITVPKDMAALIIQRSSLNRSGIQILSSLYDSGYCNFGGATIYPFMDAKIERGSRVVQIVYFKAEAASSYDGVYKRGI